jgi:hypothetical protein
MLWGLVLLELGLRLQESLSLGRVITFIVIVVAAVFSDRLVATQFLVPLAGTALVVVMLRRRWALLIGLLVIVLSTGTAAISAQAYMLFTQKHTPFIITPAQPQFGTREQFAQCLPVFWASWQRVAGPTTLFFAYIVAGFVAASIIAVLEYRDRRRAGVDRGRAGTGTILLFVLLSSASAIAVPVLTCIWQDIDNFRYAIGLIIWPALLLTLAGAWAAHRMSSRRAAIAGAIALCFGAICWLPALFVKPVHASAIFYSPAVRFVDAVVTKYRLHNGYAGYWESRPIALSSKTGVMLSVIDDPRQQPRFWVDNPNHWCQVPGGPPGAYPYYDFLVCRHEDQQQMVDHFGPPAAVEVGSNLKFRILIYNRRSDVAFRNYGRVAALHAAHLKLPRKIINHPVLNELKDDGCAWNSKGVIAIPPGRQLALNIAPPLGGDLLQIMTNARYEYQIEFRLGPSRVGSFQLPAMKVPGMRLQEIPLESITGGKPFDTIIITPPEGPGDYSVGTVIVLPDSSANLVK